MTCQPVLIDLAALHAHRQDIPADDPARRSLAAAAAQAIDAPTPTVMDKTVLPPSGDRHDYLSMGPYWWPDPDRPDGRPYIRRDGEVNPEGAALDRTALQRMCGQVSDLATAAFYGAMPAAAEAAAAKLRAWFLDPATAMHPHLRYGQSIPGICDGRGIGIIDTVSLVGLLDQIVLCVDCGGLSQASQAGLADWFGRYLDWLLTSDLGQAEAGEHNNHGTWYDVQVAALALFCGRPDVCRAVCAAVPERRLAGQIAADGSQPHELARTLSFGYSCMNLRAMVLLARLGQRVGVDLIEPAGPGAAIRRALDWLEPYATGSRPWTWQQIKPVEDHPQIGLYRCAALWFGESRYEAVLAALDPAVVAAHRVQLIYPLVGQ